MNTSENLSIVNNPWLDQPPQSLHELLKAGNYENSDQQLDALYSHTSVANKLADLRKVTSMAHELKKTRVQIHKMKLNKEVHDLVSADALQEKHDAVKLMVEDLESAIGKKDQLAKRLQQPYQGEQLTVEAQYQETAIKLLEQIDTCINNINEQCETTEWHSNHELSEPSIVHSLRNVSGQVDSLMSNLAHLQEMKTNTFP
uniref:Uncharacterized protein n=1 Tax=Ciona savignyi TaxID=51511 RepID=H2ZQ39_CIOSA